MKIRMKDVLRELGRRDVRFGDEALNRVNVAAVEARTGLAKISMTFDSKFDTLSRNLPPEKVQQIDKYAREAERKIDEARANLYKIIQITK